MAGNVAGDPTPALLELVQHIVRDSSGTGDSQKAGGDGGGGGGDLFRKDCTDLVRKISLLSHLFEEIRDFTGGSSSRSSPEDSWWSDLASALQFAKRLLSVASSFVAASSFDGEAKKIAFQFQCVTWKLEKALGKLPYEQFDISDEVQEQVELVRAQLKRAADKYGPMNSNLLSRTMSQPALKDLDLIQSGRAIGTLHIQNIGNVDHEVSATLNPIPNPVPSRRCPADHKIEIPTNSSTSSEVSSLDADRSDLSASDLEDNPEKKSAEENKKSDAIPIPDDFLCPISLEIMRDPVIVATGQTYERSYIQRWIDNGNLTCPKTQQKLQNLTLTPNYVLRSLISQWCSTHNVEQPTGIVNGKIKNSDGSFRDISSEIATIEALVRKLSSCSIEEITAAVTEIRSLSKRSTDNRILIAEAGAIPPLVHLLTSVDVLIQENAVTSILNLSIYENNKGLIMLAGAIPSIVQVLRAGSMEARENAAATLFSLSLGDENKIIIGASGAIPALVDLLQTGSTRGKKDAATALFNLCIYQGNKGRAVRAGIISALLKMLTDSSHRMVDEALTILSVLASCQEAKVAMVKASTIPVLIDLLRMGLPRNKENAAAILLSLCKRDSDNLGCISRLGASIPLTELARNGTERAKRKATSLLDLLHKLHKQ
ncbi:U-box domain-containing protein 11-like [Punica granatum]|uniref:RING-type E3 ubiquitin transferase n=2 Tax=Punica granatum TaxID=22663 RepID=A0A218XP09_PUNGR|nr:U-box domain-containing protein 11-like [Punica granatum]OWM86231.1 hypothetical protein CDL15_Pgr011055 [Punica granatum]PKI44252.1 hypothetical protein CRG98_035326 [Punica granatum]